MGGDKTHMKETWAFLCIASSIQSNLCLVSYIILSCMYISLAYPLSNYLSTVPSYKTSKEKCYYSHEQLIWTPPSTPFFTKQVKLLMSRQNCPWMKRKTVGTKSIEWSLHSKWCLMYEKMPNQWPTTTYEHHHVHPMIVL